MVVSAKSQGRTWKMVYVILFVFIGKDQCHLKFLITNFIVENNSPNVLWIKKSWIYTQSMSNTF